MEAYGNKCSWVILAKFLWDDPRRRLEWYDKTNFLGEFERGKGQEFRAKDLYVLMGEINGENENWFTLFPQNIY